MNDYNVMSRKEEEEHQHQTSNGTTGRSVVSKRQKITHDHHSNQNEEQKANNIDTAVNQQVIHGHDEDESQTEKPFDVEQDAKINEAIERIDETDSEIRSHSQFWRSKYNQLKNVSTIAELEKLIMNIPHFTTGLVQDEHVDDQTDEQLIDLTDEQTDDIDGAVLELEKLMSSRGIPEDTTAMFMLKIKENAKRSKEDKRLLLEDKRLLLVDKRLLLEDKRLLQENAKFKDKKEDIMFKLEEIHHKASSIEKTLLALSSLSQAEGTKSSNTDVAKTQMKQAQEFDIKVKKMFAGHMSDAIAGTSSELFRDVLNTKKYFSTGRFHRDLFIQTNAGSIYLERVSKIFDKCLANSTMLTRKECHNYPTTYKQAIKKSVARLRSSFKSVIPLGELDLPSEKLIYPGPTSQEVGVQLIMDILLEAVGDVCQVVFSKCTTETYSTPKSHISQQKVVLGNAERKARRCDFSVWNRRRYMVVLLDGFMELTFEIKPGQRTGTNVMGLYNEGRDQILSHLSKSLLHSLRLGEGIGVPSHATGIYGSLTHIEIIQLVLKSPGTVDACLELLSTGPLPLVTEKSYTHWFKADKRSVHAVKEMKSLLYSKHNDKGMDKSGVPLGIKALHALMTCPRQELIGPIWGSVSSQYAPHLGELIGSGTFGMVFRCEYGSETVALKVSKSKNYFSIKRETAILKYLSEDENRPKSVTSFRDSGQLKLKIGGVDLKVPALISKPVGTTIYSIFSKQNCIVFDIITAIWRDVGEALSFIHAKGICHNDINDNNIMLFQTGDNCGEWKAVLIDFGIASTIHGKMTGFYGTAPFVHREIHENYYWFPVAEFDWTSLGFTLIVLIEFGVIPWKGLNSKGSKTEDNIEDVYTNRLNLAEAVLNENGPSLDPKLATDIRKLVLLDKKKFLFGACKCSRLPCTPSRCGCFSLTTMPNQRCSVLCQCYDEASGTFCCNMDDSRVAPLPFQIDADNFNNDLDFPAS